MEYASRDLMNEHEAILFSLEILDEIAKRAGSGTNIFSGDITELIDFLKLFADKCHHGKEEGFYFPALEQAGIPKENGPIGVMLSEHETGRKYIRQMSEAVSGAAINKNEFIESGQGYINLLRAHIKKENNVLFPMGDERLPEAKQKELLIAFEEFEDKVIGKGKHEELHAMLNTFEKKYLK